MSAIRRCVDCVSAKAFDIFSQGADLESCGFLGDEILEQPDDLCDCEPETRTDVSAVPVLTDVVVSPSSVVTESWDGVSLDSVCEFY